MKTSIFYVNSFGMMCQWKGEVLNITNTTIDIKFNKNKALRYQLLNLDIDFVLVTKKMVKCLGVGVDVALTSVSFDEQLTQKVLTHKDIINNNIQYLWRNKKWEIKS